ncbi:MAG: hypothetical protein ACLSHC_11660 [Bilophila wadsworthia]
MTRPPHRRLCQRVIEIKDGSIISDTRSREFVPAPERELPARPRLLPVPQGSVRRGVQNVGAGHPRPQMRSVLTMLGIIIGIASVVTPWSRWGAGRRKDHRQHQLDGHKHHQRLSRARLRRP